MTCLDPKTIWPNEAVPNVRYRDFSKMVLFTAGDEDQFERKRSYKNGTNPDKKVSLDGNIGQIYSFRLKVLNLNFGMGIIKCIINNKYF